MCWGDTFSDRDFTILRGGCRKQLLDSFGHRTPCLLTTSSCPYSQRANNPRTKGESLFITALLTSTWVKTIHLLSYLSVTHEDQEGEVKTDWTLSVMGWGKKRWVLTHQQWVSVPAATDFPISRAKLIRCSSWGLLLIFCVINIHLWLLDELKQSTLTFIWGLT